MSAIYTQPCTFNPQDNVTVAYTGGTIELQASEAHSQALIQLEPSGARELAKVLQEYADILDGGTV